MAYLEKKGSVWILFDNLDKGWSTQGVDVIDAIVLRCLIDAGRKIEREMRKGGREFHCLVFVRNDVYDHVMRNSADYGKEMRAVLDWTDTDLLKEMLKLRLVNGMRIAATPPPFEQLWQRICIPIYKGEETSNFFVSCSLMRPRNLLKIFNHCRGFAVNFGHARIEIEDIEKGFKAYSHDLLSELDHELSDVSPSWRNLLYHFIDAPSTMSVVEMKVLLREANIEANDLEKVLDFLLYYGIIGVRTLEADHYIFDVMYDERALKARASRNGEKTNFVINPAFWPALEIRESELPRPV
ncbi:MAG: hypothetical protein IT541_04855 [Hyphomicrobiales bacterium]|nr:hypothetical protein [Hyphomicrobiales bacterium]